MAFTTKYEKPMKVRAVETMNIKKAKNLASSPNPEDPEERLAIIRLMICRMMVNKSGEVF